VANLGVVGDGALIAPAEFEIAYVDAECGERRADRRVGGAVGGVPAGARFSVV
jgi:hypothetical protein